MRKRSKAREYALQILYQIELTRKEVSLDEFWWQAVGGRPEQLVEEEVRVYAERLMTLVTARKVEIDAAITKSAEHWEMDRMAVVDKNILRIGVCELMFCEDIPSKVAINESIELAKKYGDAESSRFVNGILDHVAKQVGHHPAEAE